tara:strand:- start:368 stop:1426 length:1059 start_codon:yes stop_codon:yes gene_type:complete
MSHKWWHPFKSDEEKRLEELRKQEEGIVRYGPGSIELMKPELEQIRKEINQLKIDNPDNETIQSGFNNIVIEPKDDFPQGDGIFENVKRNVVNTALEKAGVPSALNYDSGTNILESFQQEGTAGVADTVANYIKDYGVEQGIQLALNANIPINTVISVLNNPLLKPVTGPLMSNAGTMFGDLTGGYGPQIFNILNNPLDLFGSTGIMSNYGNRDQDPDPPVVQQQSSVIDDYIASLGQSNTTQNNDGSQTISGGTTNPADDIVVTNLPKPVYRPTMADVAGPSSNNNSTPSQPAFSPQDRNIQPAKGPVGQPFSPQDRNIQPASATEAFSRFGRFGRANGGLVSVSRYLKGR